MRIAFLNWRDLSHPEGGGAERYAQTICAGLASRGHEVVLFCAAHGDAPALDHVDGYRIVRSGGRVGVYPSSLRALHRDALRAAGGRPVVAVLNKTDLLPSTTDKMAGLERLRALDGVRDAVAVSAATGDGLDLLRRAVAAAAGGPEAVAGPTLLLERHRSLIRTAADALTAAAASTAGEECLTVDLRRALDAFNQVTGRGVSDEVLHAIFSRFCIGK